MMAKYTAVLLLDTRRKPVVLSDDSLAVLLPKLVELLIHDDGVITLMEDGVEIPFPDLRPALVATVGGKEQVILYPDTTSVVNSDGRFTIP